MKVPNIVKDNKSVINLEHLKDNGILDKVVTVNETLRLNMIDPDMEIDSVKHIKKIESIIRGSHEYKNYIRTLKTDFNLSSCKFYKNVDVFEDKFSLEMHHYPATLFDIVQAFYNYLYDTKQYFRSLDKFYIAEEVMKLHYLGHVGLVPLTKTSHELAHEGHLFIPLTDEYVFGNYNEMINSDQLNFSDNFKDALNTINLLTQDYIESGENDTEEVFKLKTVKVVMKEAEKPLIILKDEDMSKLA